ncbi:hypothetical protein GCM10023155_03640 [Bremerella cremea]
MLSCLIRHCKPLGFVMLWLALLANGSQAADASLPQLPNVLLLVADDLQRDFIGLDRGFQQISVFSASSQFTFEKNCERPFALASAVRSDSFCIATYER